MNANHAPSSPQVGWYGDRTLRFGLLLFGVLGFILLGLSSVHIVRADTLVSGRITTPQHWTLANSPYLVTQDVYIDPGGSLTIDPGVQVKIADNMWIRVQGGSLNVQGSASNPVVFTAATNRWRYLSVENGSAQLSHCVIEQAGLQANEAALRIWGSVPVQDCVVRNNGGHGIELNGEGATATLNRVTVTGNAGVAIYQTTINMNPTYREVTLSNNGQNSVRLPSGTLNRAVSLDSTGIRGGMLVLDYDLYVPAQTSLTLQPGTTLVVDSDNVWIRVQGGTFVAEGSVLQPIVLTSLGDGRWRYLSFENNSHARLAYCTIEGTGYSPGEAALAIIGSSDVELRHCTIRNGRGPGLSLQGEGITPLFEDVTVNGHSGFALVYDTINMQPRYHNVTLTGNNPDAVRLPSGRLSRNVTLDGPGINGSPFILDYDLLVPAQTTLSLLPGTTFAFDLDNVWLRVQGGSLLAEGTATQPITFTAAYTMPSPGLYRMLAIDSGSARLSHCVINSAGMSNDPAILIASTQNVQISDCSIYGNQAEAIRVINDATPLLKYNRIYANGFGVRNTSTRVFVDARQNYWGADNGPYHAVLNPNGTGNAVSDRVLFQPYADASGTSTSRLFVEIGGPMRASPGEVSEFVVSYLNQTVAAVEDAVLVLNLPTDSDYVESEAGGIYWPQRHQVFWKLGTLEAGGEGLVTVRVRFAWGLPLGWKQQALAQLAGRNQGDSALDLAAYLAYTPVVLPTRTPMSDAATQAHIAASPDLTGLYEIALNEGYRFGRGETLTWPDGMTVFQVGLARPERNSAAVLRHGDDNWAWLTMYSPDQYVLRDATGGMTMSLQTAKITYWGSWEVLDPQLGLSAVRISEDQCLRNCRLTKLALMVPSMVSKKVSWVMSVPQCYACGRGGNPEACGTCMWEMLNQLERNLPVAAEIIDLAKCKVECYAPTDRDKYVCQNDLTMCAGTSVSWFGRTRPVWIRWKCNQNQGMWGGLPEVLYCSGVGEVCVPGAKDSTGSPCQFCEDALLRGHTTARTKEQVDPCATLATAGGACGSFPGPEMRPAHDPNEKSGLTGDVLPGQSLTYTISYENEGSGEAFGVYVVDDLDPAFDEQTLVLNGPATYYPSTRTIIWNVGDLAPKGQPGATGTVSFTVQLKPGLPSGTTIANQAIVYFPSVPEETPTNTWINRVMPVVATPQRLSTGYTQPLAITLRGRDVSNSTLSYTLVDLPRGGTLSGTAPNLTYTPMANFVGLDAFSFQVSNGLTTSRTAQVVIDVTATGDMTAPMIVWTNPVAGATDVAAPSAPIFPDLHQPGYAPLITLGVSEALAPSTVHSGTVRLIRSNGSIVPATISFEASLHQIVVMPQTALVSGTYQVMVLDEVTDLAGNRLDATFRMSFGVKSSITNQPRVYLPLVRRV